MPGAFAWTGVPALFARAGYEEMERDEPDHGRFARYGRRCGKTGK